MEVALHELVEHEYAEQKRLDAQFLGSVVRVSLAAHLLVANE